MLCSPLCSPLCPPLLFTAVCCCELWRNARGSTATASHPLQPRACTPRFSTDPPLQRSRPSRSPYLAILGSPSLPGAGSLLLREAHSRGRAGVLLFLPPLHLRRETHLFSSLKTNGSLSHNPIPQEPDLHSIAGRDAVCKEGDLRAYSPCRSQRYHKSNREAWTPHGSLTSYVQSRA
ncbi:hypothetical protein BGZ57DRAFT_464440 [Hyaloscypha finlandica]|nr:hypothetical protein BGZ57DRAFT_464440 [Hyaloscypha finlandica]